MMGKQDDKGASMKFPHFIKPKLRLSSSGRREVMAAATTTAGQGCILYRERGLCLEKTKSYRN